eukprot:gene8185-13_t
MSTKPIDKETDIEVFKKNLKEITEKYEKLVQEQKSKEGFNETKSKAENFIRKEKEKYEKKMEEIKEKLTKLETKNITLTKKNLELEIEIEQIQIFKKKEADLLLNLNESKEEISNLQTKNKELNSEIEELKKEKENLTQQHVKEIQKYKKYMREKFPDSMTTSINGMTLDAVQFHDDEEDEKKTPEQQPNPKEKNTQKEKPVSLEKYTKILPIKDCVESILNYFENLPKDVFDDEFSSSSNPSSIFMINSTLCEVLIKVFNHGLNKSKYWFSNVYFWNFIGDTLMQDEKLSVFLEKINSKVDEIVLQNKIQFQDSQLYELAFRLFVFECLNNQNLHEIIEFLLSKEENYSNFYLKRALFFESEFREKIVSYLSVLSVLPFQLNIEDLFGDKQYGVDIGPSRYYA